MAKIKVQKSARTISKKRNERGIRVNHDTIYVLFPPRNSNKIVESNYYVIGKNLLKDQQSPKAQNISLG